MPGKKYDDAERADILARVFAGIEEGKSVSDVCREPGMPAASTVWDWLAASPATSESYARARERRAAALADRIARIADKVEAGAMDPNAARVAGDLLKWTAARMDPKNWGDRMQHDHNVNVHAAQVEALRAFTAPALAAPDVIEGTFVDVTDGAPRAKDADADLDDMLS